MKNKILNVLYQSDDHYILASAASITSLLINNKQLDEINIYYIGLEISEENKLKLNQLVDLYHNAKLFFVDAQENNYNELFKELPGAKAWNDRYITWYKLIAFGEMDFPTDRVLYLNPHTIITNSLEDLVELDFEDNIFALSYDCLLESHKLKLGLTKEDRYYNCGVMLVNTSLWKEKKMTTFCLEELRKENQYIIVDQDFCNILFRNEIKLLGPEFNYSSAYYAYSLKLLLKTNNLSKKNYYSYEQLRAEFYEPKIIHSSFGLTGKPWEAGNQHPNKEIWNKYINLSPWKGQPRPEAKRTLAWMLYDYLPKPIFMKLYKIAVERKLKR